MAFFGKSDSELKAWEEELGKRENECSLQSTKLEDKEERLKEEQKKILSKSKELAEKESDLTKRELDAKNGFSEQHEKSFAENIRNQLEQLNQRKSELASLEASYSQQLKEVNEKESKLLERERAIKEREVQADAGFASKNRISLRELEQKENDIRRLEEALKKKEKDILTRVQKLDNREENIKRSEEDRDSGYIDNRKELMEELRIEKSNFNKALDAEREEKLLQLDKEIEKKFENIKNKLEEEKSKVKEENLILEEQKEEFEYDKKRLKSREERLEKREENINQEIEEGVKERKKSFESELNNVQMEVDRLRESLSQTSSILNIFEELKRKLGDEDPEVVIKKLNTQVEEIKELKEELINRPTSEMIETFDAMKNEKERLADALSRLSEENERLRKSQMEVDGKELDIEALKQKNSSLESRFESVSADNNRLTEDLKRIQASYKREEDRDDRINNIKSPYFKKILPRSSSQASELALMKIEEGRSFSEIEWLENIRLSCEDYGLKFPKRILYAFHTALKTSEWSPLTVLAGVSGTGKSELPRLYSHFGGINFLSLAVQPNWDSQESMLGFFNSIDNEFDAQPVLRLLAQSQEKKTNEYPEGLEDTMNLVLLDEMNLAYVELYFAEFLSKLELRRGKKGSDVPSLEIKLGSGVEPLQLPLGRNVLWTGTMNQDETTKSLSDKVLDRGMVLHFPRPKSFERRKKLKPLSNQSPLLSRKDWESWWVKETKFTDKQIEPFKSFIEELNDYLATVGRALGHRVWQSMEYYMANHPEVQQALEEKDDSKIEKTMKIAFEDQLVLKVMPKLRGIETRGRSKTECLDKIRHLLDEKNYSILSDFDTACESGYGQFMWNSAKYLDESENLVEKPSENKKNIDNKKKENLEVKAKAKILKIDKKNNVIQCLSEVEKGFLTKDSIIDIVRNGKKIISTNIKKVCLIDNDKLKEVKKVNKSDGQVFILLDNKLQVEENDFIFVK